MVESLAYQVTLTTMSCGECGGTYAINERFNQLKREKGGGWNCPYCKTGWGYFNTSEVIELRKLLELEQKRTEWAKQDASKQKARAQRAEYRERAQKAAKTRIKNRISNGVCPCCNRTFANLAGHMQTKHPEYTSHD